MNYKKGCEGCFYWRRLSNHTTIDLFGCHHLLLTKQRRKRGERGECLSRDEKGTHSPWRRPKKGDNDYEN